MTIELPVLVVERRPEQPASCRRCFNANTRLIPCYWDPKLWVCPECAGDLARLHDKKDSWPVEGRWCGPPPGEPEEAPELPEPGPRPPGWPTAAES